MELRGIKILHRGGDRVGQGNNPLGQGRKDPKDWKNLGEIGEEQ